MGIGWEIAAILFLILGLISIVFVLANTEESDGTYGHLIILFILSLFVVVNSYTGNEIFVGTVEYISKVDYDGKIITEISSNPKVIKEKSKDILKAYQVAVYFPNEKKLKIYVNKNSLLRFKFDKAELQLQLLPGKKYKFKVCNLFFRKNILKIEEL